MYIFYSSTCIVVYGEYFMVYFFCMVLRLINMVYAPGM